MKTLLFAPGFACTAGIWAEARDQRIDARLVHAQWDPDMHTVAVARDHLSDLIASTMPDAYVGHSLGGLLLLELLVVGRVPARPSLIVDAFLTDPADMFKNFVWEDDALRTAVTASLDEQRPRFAALRASIADWQRPGWPRAALETGAHFVYGGRGASEAEVIRALGWPSGYATPGRLTILPRTSHFLMLEAPEAFYALVKGLLAR